MDQAHGLRITEYFRARLAEETRRAERYGRSFTVVFVSCRQTDAREVFNNIRPLLRSTDLVEVIRGRQSAPAPGGPSAAGAPGAPEVMYDRVAIILPETDRPRAEATVGRLQANLKQLKDVALGMAVYPEDGKTPQDLLSRAAAAAGETFRP